MRAPEPLVEAHDIHVRYRGRHVLRGASLSAHAGQIVAVLGENGSGKSTLLRVLAGAQRPDRGEVRTPDAVGYCPQEQTLYPYLTPEEHARLFGRAYRLPPQLIRERATALFDAFGLGGDRARVVEELSGGTKQKVNLCLALLHQPSLLLLDEPYAGFDVETYRRFVAFSEEARRRGTCIVLVTHIAFDRERFDRIAHLRDGVLHVDGG